MPDPIVPPPIWPTGRGVALRISGTVGTDLSARKMYRNSKKRFRSRESV